MTIFNDLRVLKAKVDNTKDLLVKREEKLHDLIYPVLKKLKIERVAIDEVHFHNEDKGNPGMTISYSWWYRGYKNDRRVFVLQSEFEGLS